MRNEKRGNWHLLTGLVLGVILGLVYTWVFSPTEYADTYPYSLRSDYKDAYRAVIAAAYDVTGDLKRAIARLELLREDDPASILAAQSQRYLAEGYSYNDALALARLSADLGDAPEPGQFTPTAIQDTETPTVLEVLESPTVEAEIEEVATVEGEAVEETSETVETQDVETTPEVEEDLPTATPEISPTPTLTRTPFLTFTPLPTRTPTPTLAPPYILLEQALVCDPVYDDAIIQIMVQNSAGEGVPGVEIILQSEGVEEHFFTGLKPELGWGYADYVMEPEAIYSMHIVDGGEPVDLFVPECDAGQGQRYWGSWRLVFTHP